MDLNRCRGESKRGEGRRGREEEKKKKKFAEELNRQKTNGRFLSVRERLASSLPFGCLLRAATFSNLESYLLVDHRTKDSR